MIFIAGASTKQKQLDFHQGMICPHCGKYGQYEVFVQYMCFSLFFIPIFRWNKKYTVRSRCCGSIYSIDNKLGTRIEKGEDITIDEGELQVIQTGSHYGQSCPNCGYEIKEDYKYCPNCSTPLQ